MESSEQTELISKTDGLIDGEQTTAIVEGRLGVKGLRKKDSWAWTTVWRLWGESGIRGLNGNGKIQ